MKSINRIVGWLIPIALFIFSVAILIVADNVANSNIGNDELFSLVNKLTDWNRICQIITTLFLFIIGFFVATSVLKDESLCYVAVWAMPIAVVIWCICSMVLLLFGVPYTRITGLILFVLVSFAFVFKNRACLNLIKWDVFIKICIVADTFIIIFSTGLLPTIMSSDSYYYVMQYGEILAKVGKLSFDTAGSTMTWTGISSALISSLAEFYGFETIVTIHFVLISSLITVFYLEIKKILKKQISNNQITVTLSGVITIALVVMPSFELLSSWVISNTYCMVFMFFLMIGVNKYAMATDKNLSLIVLLSFIVVWLCLSRAEMCVCMAGMVIFMTFLPLKKAELMILSIPMTLFQIFFLIRLDVQQFISDKSVYDTMITPAIQALMIAAMFFCIMYCSFCDAGWFKIRKHIHVIMIVALPILSLSIYFLDDEKYMTSIDSIIYNLKNEFWGYTPIFILILIVVKLVFNRKVSFYGLFAYGYVFLNLAFALIRKQPLRYGYGDSFNRMLISALPIVYFALIHDILMYWKEQDNEIET